MNKFGAGVLAFSCMVGCGARQRSVDTPVAGAVAPDKVTTAGDDMFECDALAGHYSKWSHAIADTGQVSGWMYFYTVRSDPNWLPWGSVLLRPKEGTPTAGMVAGRPRGKDVLLLNSAYQDAGQYRQALLIPELPLATDVHFTFRWSPGKIEVQLAHDPSWHPIPIGFTPARLGLGCSTADVVFHDISIKSPASPP